jgi:hypothetical protein
LFLAIFIFISNRGKFSFFELSKKIPPQKVTRFYPELQQVAQNIEGLNFFTFKFSYQQIWLKCLMNDHPSTTSQKWKKKPPALRLFNVLRSHSWAVVA